MSDGKVDPDPPKRGHEVAFFAFIAILMVAVFGGAAYLLSNMGGSDHQPAARVNPTSGSTVPGTTTRHGDGESRAAALAVVERNFRLALAGKHREACALESPAYLRFDARNYSQGSCAAGSKAATEVLAAHGLSMKMISARVKSFSAGEATVVVNLVLGSSKHVAENVYVQYHAGKWWITGADDSGDLGYQ